MPSPATVPQLTLSTGAAMPQLGFGVFEVPPNETIQPVRLALEEGYRLIDTAESYGNEAGVGRAIEASGLAREDVFVTTKVRKDHAPGAVADAFERSLEQLQLDYVDLYLIHWPVPAIGAFVEIWHVLERLHADGRARAIGTANFRIPDLERLLPEANVVPAVNQIELHPLLAQRELRAFHARHGIVTQAWSPLARSRVLDQPLLAQIAQAHDRSAAQVVLRWHLQHGHGAIPRSQTPSRIADNIDVFDFALRDDEMAAIDALDAGHRIGHDPATWGNPA
jgi:2,5-diketo-D-gluconate reductase A